MLILQPRYQENIPEREVNPGQVGTGGDTGEGERKHGCRQVVCGGLLVVHGLAAQIHCDVGRYGRLDQGGREARSRKKRGREDKRPETHASFYHIRPDPEPYMRLPVPRLPEVDSLPWAGKSPR